jgi:hypothetical protein
VDRQVPLVVRRPYGGTTVTETLVVAGVSVFGAVPPLPPQHNNVPLPPPTVGGKMAEPLNLTRKDHQHEANTANHRSRGRHAVADIIDRHCRAAVLYLI